MTPTTVVPSEAAIQSEANNLPVSKSISTSDTADISMEKTTDKTLIRKRLVEAVKAAPVAQGRSTDLTLLTEEYEKNRKNLRILHEAAKKYQETLVALNASRVEMVDKMALMSVDTPVYNAIGNPDVDSKSLLARARMCAATTDINAQKFEVSILDYITEWDNLTSSRIDYEIKEAGKLRDRRTHYEEKLHKLRKNVHKKEDKDGKEVKSSDVSKVERNEKKLKDSHEEHEEYCSRLAVLIEEASTKVGRWRDLVPVAQSYMEWEIERCAGEKLCLGTLQEAIDSMKYDIKDFEKSRN